MFTYIYIYVHVHNTIFILVCCVSVNMFDCLKGLDTCTVRYLRTTSNDALEIAGYVYQHCWLQGRHMFSHLSRSIHILRIASQVRKSTSKFPSSRSAFFFWHIPKGWALVEILQGCGSRGNRWKPTEILPWGASTMRNMRVSWVIGVPVVIIHFRLGFSLINHSFLG